MVEEVQRPTPIEPMQAPKGGKSKRLTGAALTAFIVSTVASTAYFTTGFEGEVHKVYRDPAGIPTYCIGETQNPDPSHIYTKGECQTLLRKRMAKDYAPQIISCVPDFADPTHQLAFQASLDASYNAGPAAFCRSPMAQDFKAGRWDMGCTGFIGWYETARGKKFPGLVTRRRAEVVFCLTGRMPK